MLFVVAGPSGVGKSSVSRRLLEEFPRLSLSVSCTTRPKRRGETDGVHYHFVERGEFEAMVERGEFAEHATVHGNLYGTTRRTIDEAGAQGLDLIFDIDVQGAASLRDAYPDAVTCMLLPPSVAVLEERLRGRGTDSDDVIAGRLAAALGELDRLDEFEFAVVNDTLDETYELVRAVYLAGGQRTQARIDALRRGIGLPVAGSG